MFTRNLYLKTLKSQFQNPQFRFFASRVHNPTSYNPSLNNPAIQFALNEAREVQSARAQSDSLARKGGEFSPHRQGSVQISHPWPEWVDLMERLLKNGYFDGIGNPFENSGELGNKVTNSIRTACLNFARDQYQLIRHLSRKDILAIVRFGCPSTDRKVVNSGKRLRAHVEIDEGNVCSSCILRGDCDRAYVRAREDEGGRTVDVMRILVTYGLDPVVDSVVNKPCLNKRVKESVRTLLKEILDNSVEVCDPEPPKVTASYLKSSTEKDSIDQERNRVNGPMKHGDWICPKCNFLNFARNVKCLRCDEFFEERLKKLAEEQEHLPLKKGDWICERCKFLNFARNTRCLQCREKPPKRQLNGGEWECDSCNYINFKRNMVCLKCDHKRPIVLRAANAAYQPLRNREIQPGFVQDKQSLHEHNDSLTFVESDNQEPCLAWRTRFMDFPISGGKSDLSSNRQRQESWKMEMENRSRTSANAVEENGRNDSCSHGKIAFLASDDEDDGMGEWFGDGKKSSL